MHFLFIHLFCIFIKCNFYNMNEKQTKKRVTVRTIAGGTLTSSQFWSKIRSALRQASRYWKPVQDCKKAAKRPYKGLNKRLKFEYKCNGCKNYFPEKEISVDHITPCGSLNNGDDLKGFVERLFVEVDFLQTLCKKCHDLKSIQDKINIKNNKL